jgi:hypothetical protein
MQDMLQGWLRLSLPRASRCIQQHVSTFTQGEVGLVDRGKMRESHVLVGRLGTEYAFLRLFPHQGDQGCFISPAPPKQVFRIELS